MSEENSSGVAGRISHGDASSLFPIEALSGEIYQYRDAQLRLQATDPAKVLAVSPTGLASGYYLTQHPLTAIEVKTLSDEVRNEIVEQTQVDMDRFELIKIGRAPRRITNHSLKEYV